MKKFIVLCFGIAIQTLTGFEAKAVGPFLPPPYQLYQTNPTSKMGTWEKTAVKEAFSWAEREFKRNHTYLCKNRGECLDVDLRTLQTFINRPSIHPAKSLFKKIHDMIHHDSQYQKFVTQWVIFENLSVQGKGQYYKGVRLTQILPQNVITRFGERTRAHFDQDDVLTDLLQKVDHHHKNCNEFITCLRGDLKILNHLHENLAPTDPVRSFLKILEKNIKNLASNAIFDTIFYLKLYNPLTPDWNDTLKKHKAKKITAYGYKEWRQVEKNSRAVSWRAPRVTNGQPLRQGVARR